MEVSEELREGIFDLAGIAAIVSGNPVKVISEESFKSFIKIKNSHYLKTRLFVHVLLKNHGFRCQVSPLKSGISHPVLTN